MRDGSTYKRYAEECRRLANVMPEEHRRTILEIGDAWTKLAQEAERENSPGRA
jgi:hypothetical protein